MKRSCQRPFAGFSLTEVIIALGIVALVVPVVLVLVVNAGETSANAERETRAVMTARTVFEEIRRAEVGSGEIVKQADLKWGTGGAAPNVGVPSGGGGGASEAGSDWLLLLLDREGNILEVASDMAYEDRYEGQDPEVTTLAAVRGYSVEVPGLTTADAQPIPNFQLELRVESPARADAAHRERETFIKSDSNR